MAETQELIYNVTGQSLVYVAPSRPSSITSVSVFAWDAGDDDTAESATTGSPSIDSVSTTVDAASGLAQANPRQLFVASTSGIDIGRQYIVTGSSGETERVEVVEIAADDHVVCRSSLSHDYVNGNTFESSRVTISVDSTWVADENNVTQSHDPNPGYRIKWVWEDADSVSHVDYTYARLVRSPGRHDVTSADMEIFLPGWHSLLPRDHRADNGQRVLDEAHKQVKWDLHASGIADEQVRNQDSINEAVKRAAAVRLQYARIYAGGGDEVTLRVALDDYNSLMDRLFRIETKVPISKTSESSGARVDAGGIWSR